MRHCDINLTMGFYTHIGLQDKAEAVSKLPTIQIIKQKQVKTGAADVPENSIANSDGNPINITQNTVKSIKAENQSDKEFESVTTFKDNELQGLAKIGVLGFEPRTYALKVRCSTS